MSQDRQIQSTATPRLNPSNVYGDEEARNISLTLGLPKVIQINVASKDTLGLPQVGTTESEMMNRIAQNVAVGEQFGIDAEAYRDSAGLTHDGKKVMENVDRIRFDLLLQDLEVLGYKHRVSRWRAQTPHPAKYGQAPKSRPPRLEFIFTLDGEATPMSETVTTFLKNVYADHLHIWCNPKMSKEGVPFRMDTINVQAGPSPKDTVAKPGVRLLLVNEPVAPDLLKRYLEWTHEQVLAASGYRLG